jgi:geranylgeranyl reductase family protein
VYDVIVAGAGPAGSSAAGFCAKAGLSVLVLEEHGSAGYPVQCAGILSEAAFAECRVSEKSVYNTVSGAGIFGSSGHGFSFDAGKTMARIVDRGRLDAEIAARAADAGAVFSMKTCVTKIHPAARRLETTGVSGREDIPYNILIAADGPRSVVARGLGIPPSRYIYSGIQAEITGSWDTHQVELYPNASPDFFAWVIPLSENRARAGLCGMQNVPERFSAFLKRFQPGNVHEVTGTIPIGIRKRTFGSGCMLAGDAAGFPKPTSGGGVYTGIRSARHAGAVAVAACETGDTSDAALSAYQKRWYADFGRELETGMQLLNLRRSISPGEMDGLIDTFRAPEIASLITGYGDMDRPSGLAKKLMMHPVLAGKIGLLGAKGLFRTLFST